MTAAMVLGTMIFCAGMCFAGAGDTAPVCACNLKAIQAADRPRYTALVKRVRRAMTDRSEVANGYTYRLDSQKVTLPDIAEWISMERLCCPFLSLQLSASGNQPHWLLTLTGAEGVKPLLDAEFPR